MAKDFNPKDGIILITATVHGRIIAKVRLVFDTGATYCMLPEWLVKSLGIVIDPNKSTQTITASKIETSPFVKIPRIEVLGHSVNNVTCMVRDLPRGASVDGLLGLSFLKYFKIGIDFSEGEITLERFLN